MMKAYDLIIVGAGAAGLSAAVYASRAMLDFVVLESGGAAGGQMLSTNEIVNYPGFSATDGAELSMAMRAHAEKLGAKIINDKVLNLQTENGLWNIACENDNYTSKAVILATGATHKKLNVNGEDELRGRGVSYCAVCDGMFFKNKTVAVVGGGNTAAEDAVYLSAICEKVYLIHRRDKLRASAALAAKALGKENIIPLWNSEISEISGDFKVQSIRLKNGDTLGVDGVFIAVGVTPVSGVFSGIVKTDESGFIIAGEDGKTSASGIFAAGDVRTKNLRQIVTAASDGANAVASAERYLQNL